MVRDVVLRFKTQPIAQGYIRFHAPIVLHIKSGIKQANVLRRRSCRRKGCERELIRQIDQRDLACPLRELVGQPGIG